MNKIVTILLLSLFSVYFTGLLTGSNMGESRLLSIDKIFKLAAFALAFMILLFQRKKLNIPRDIWIYILAGTFILFSFLINYLVSAYPDDFIAFQAKKDIIRLAIILLVFVLCAAVSSDTSDYRPFVYAFAILGLLLGILTIYNSFTGKFGESWHYVDGYLRAGAKTTDSNLLGAVLNIASVAVLIGCLIQNNLLSKIFFLSLLIIIQAARFATFSTGSLLSLVITVIAAMCLLKKYHAEMLKPFLKIVLFVIFVFIIMILRTGLSNTVFYRVLLSDDVVKGSSIDSRVGQYKEYIEYIKEKPANLILGIGSVNARTMSTGGQIHNSYLRPLVEGGIVAFGCFLFLWWRCLKDFFFSIKTSQTNEVHHIVSIFFFASFIGWSFQAGTVPSDISTIQWFFFILAYMLRHSASTLPTSRVPREQLSFRPVYG